MKKKTELGKAVERRYALENPDIEVKVIRNRTYGGGTNRKVKTTGIVTEAAVDCPVDRKTLDEIFNWMRVHVRQGHDIELCGMLHVFGWVNMNMEPRCGAKAMGGMCDWLKDKKLKVVHCGTKLTETQLNDFKSQQKSAHEEVLKNGRIAVTPDTVINCPNCGTEIRVGRVLSDRG